MLSKSSHACSEEDKTLFNYQCPKKEGQSNVRTQISQNLGHRIINAHHHKFQENVVCFDEKHRKSIARQACWNTDCTSSPHKQKPKSF